MALHFIDHLIETDDMDQLTGQVNAYMAEGWKKCGSIHIATRKGKTIFVQAMIKMQRANILPIVSLAA